MMRHRSEQLSHSSLLPTSLAEIVELSWGTNVDKLKRDARRKMEIYGSFEKRYAFPFKHFFDINQNKLNEAFVSKLHIQG